MNFEIRVRSDGAIDSIRRQLEQIPDKALDYWKSVTPIRTGNARRRTKLDNDTIRADYPYAERLDDGYSRQAPKGMTQPTQKYIDRLVRNIKAK